MTAIFTAGADGPFLVTEPYGEASDAVDTRIAELEQGIDASAFVEFTERDGSLVLVRVTAIDAIRE